MKFWLVSPQLAGFSVGPAVAPISWVIIGKLKPEIQASNAAIHKKWHEKIFP